MVQIVWDKPGSHLYEVGLDRGVLYLPNGRGVPWNGLVSVEETFESDISESLYKDGVKYFEFADPGDFSATLSAFTYPDEFLQFDGYEEITQGLYATYQEQAFFGLSYRTKIGNDLKGEDFAYQIHILYNLSALQDSFTLQTFNDNPEANLFSWKISGTPISVANMRPTEHIILDSRFVNRFIMQAFETFLYGDSINNPKLPTLPELIDFVLNWKLITITDHGDGTWSATGPDELIKMTSDKTFQITEVLATYLDQYTYNVSTTAYEET